MQVTKRIHSGFELGVDHNFQGNITGKHLSSRDEVTTVTE